MPEACDICGDKEYVYRENLRIETLDDNDDEIDRWVPGRQFACTRAFSSVHGWIHFCSVEEEEPESVPAPEPFPGDECDVCGTNNYVDTDVMTVSVEDLFVKRTFTCGRQFEGKTPVKHCTAPKVTGPTYRHPASPPERELYPRTSPFVFFLKCVVFLALTFSLSWAVVRIVYKAAQVSTGS